MNEENVIMILQVHVIKLVKITKVDVHVIVKFSENLCTIMKRTSG